MNNYTFSKDGFTFIRIPKNKARVAYNNGLTVLFCACNLRPGFPWYPEISIKGHIPYYPEYTENEFDTFDYHVNSFEYYNCINSETGRYTAFYIPVKYDNWYTNKKPEYDYNYMNGGKS